MWIRIIAVTCQVVLVEPGPRYSSRIVDTQAGPLRGVSLLSITSYTNVLQNFTKNKNLWDVKKSNQKGHVYNVTGVCSEGCQLAIGPLMF